MKRVLLSLACVLLTTVSVRASQSDALVIESNVRTKHMPFKPYGIVVDPIFSSSDPSSTDYSTIVGYTRCGDSAIWTGHFLAAESTRYHVMRKLDPPVAYDALVNVALALNGIRALIDVTGTDVLARCLVPINSPYAPGITAEEAPNGVYTGTVDGQSFYWIGSTSRDQYSGIFFGLGVAWDMLDDFPVARFFISGLVTRLLNFLLAHDWVVVMPDGTVSTVFWGRPEQEVSFLQVGRHLNPPTYSFAYIVFAALYAAWTPLPISGDSLDDHNHYFKFNLDAINLFNLIRLEEPNSPFLPSYKAAYGIWWSTVETHENAHFNIIDRGLNGPNTTRDQETVALLDEWLQRPRRDYYVDLRLQYPSCGQPDRACVIIPVPQQVNTDFLWQRSPRLLFGGGSGTIETAAIDYALPYWLGRFYGLISN